MTAVQRAHTALARITTTWPLLEPAKDATLAKRRPEPRAMGKTTSASLDALLKAERGERLTAGHTVTCSAPSAAPLDLAVTDAEALVVTTLRDLAWLAASTLRTKRLGWPALQWSVPVACDFLRLAVTHVSPPLAADMATQLGQAQRALEAALQLDRHDDQLYRNGLWWVTTAGAARRLGVSPDNVRDWHRRGLAVDEHGHDHSIALGGTGGTRWHRLTDIQRAARTVGRDLKEAS